MVKEIKRIAVTGSAGQIAYPLVFALAKGELLGQSQPLALHLLEIDSMVKQLEGLKLELEDSNFPLLKEIHIGSDPEKIFKEVDYAFLIGSKPRTAGMERQDLLKENGKIFITQGKALNQVAKKTVKVLVVGNPCNTNCFIALKNAPLLNKNNFHAMTALDENRARFQLASQAKVPLEAITHVTIWGNHSSTQVPDFTHVKIKGEPLKQVLNDQHWLENDFIQLIRQRGAKIIEARGRSSAGSAAYAAIQAMKALIQPTAEGCWYSSALYSENNPYGIDPDLVFSFPCRTIKDGTIEIVKGLEITPFLRAKLELSEEELKIEKSLIKELYG